MYHAQQMSVKLQFKWLINCFDEDGGIDPVKLLLYCWSKHQKFLQGLQDIRGSKLCILHQPSDADMYRHLPHPSRRQACRKRTSMLMFDETSNIVPCTPKVPPGMLCMWANQMRIAQSSITSLKEIQNSVW